MAGFLLGAFLFSGITAYAASSQITVNFAPLKYFFDGVQKVTPSGQNGFIYQGTTYVPLRFMGESLGKEVTWDGKTSSIYIGLPPEGKTTYLQSLKPHTSEGENVFSRPSSITTNMNEQFSHSSYKFGGTGTYGGLSSSSQTAEYLSNGKFKKFEAYLAPTDYWQGRHKSDNIGYLKVYADDELVYDSGAIASDITEKVKVSVDLTGALKVKIEVYGVYFGVLDAKFIN
ncbi:hypothetical protein GN156_00010 [bacterium LRH843]|nr:hypothetical protein [bacterium LRH843]